MNKKKVNLFIAETIVVLSVVCVLISQHEISLSSIENQLRSFKHALRYTRFQYETSPLTSHSDGTTSPPALTSSATQKPVISCLRDGLGNQMFRYAAALGILRHYSKTQEVILDTAAFTQKSLRHYELSIFNIPQNVLVKKKKHSFLEWGKQLLTKDYPALYVEPFFHFDPKLKDSYTPLRGVALFGFFISPLYFEHIEQELRQKFTLKIPLSQRGQNWLLQIKQAEIAVGVHVRRGDYTHHKNKDTMLSVTDDYYMRAIELMNQLLKNQNKKIIYFIFSDDLDFCKELFKHIPEVQFVTSDPKSSHEDMILMSHCHHNIIANSTYSWWGAWLNQNPKKSVIAPYYFFTPQFMKKNYIGDIYPKEWIILK